jgi:hypothetical protein
MPPAAWELIAACWHQDPVHRPHMSEVGGALGPAHRWTRLGSTGGALVVPCT